ncbi:hypothetical protein [Opitutus sp. ER46]|uniref:hypothetical protein n=1 Tax=Opitutus sp. ER46 TaxID=2161864 RepID=UPI000D2F7DDB|nr:hypothetical protein [Opitutus sp. ER46]PTX97937.1 hypothetical protein DB354_06590 [Opitutus sp. ER46]
MNAKYTSALASLSVIAAVIGISISALSPAAYGIALVGMICLIGTIDYAAPRHYHARRGARVAESLPFAA